MDSGSSTHKSHRYPLNSRPIAQPFFLQSSPSKGLNSQRSVPAMRGHNDSIATASQSQGADRARPDPTRRIATMRSQLQSTGSPATMQVTSSSSNGRQPFIMLPPNVPVDARSREAAIASMNLRRGPNGQQPHGTTTASEYSENGSSALKGNDNHSVDDIGIDDSVCMLFEATISGEVYECMRTLGSDGVARYGECAIMKCPSYDSAPRAKASSTRDSTSRSPMRLADDQNSDSSMDDGDMDMLDNIFDSPIPVIGRPPISASHTRIGGAAPSPSNDQNSEYIRTTTPPSAKGFPTHTLDSSRPNSSSTSASSVIATPDNNMFQHYLPETSPNTSVVGNSPLMVTSSPNADSSYPSYVLSSSATMSGAQSSWPASGPNPHRLHQRSPHSSQRQRLEQNPVHHPLNSREQFPEEYKLPRSNSLPSVPGAALTPYPPSQPQAQLWPAQAPFHNPSAGDQFEPSMYSMSSSTPRSMVDTNAAATAHNPGFTLPTSSHQQRHTQPRPQEEHMLAFQHQPHILQEGWITPLQPPSAPPRQPQPQHSMWAPISRSNVPDMSPDRMRPEMNGGGVYIVPYSSTLYDDGNGGDRGRALSRSAYLSGSHPSMTVSYSQAR